MHAAAVPASSWQVMLAGLFAVVKETTPEVDVLDDGEAVIVTVGATTTVQAAVAVPVPDAFVAETTTVCAPAASPV